MQKAAGQFSLDGKELDTLAIADRVDVQPHRDDERFSPTLGKWRFALVALRLDKSLADAITPIASPFCFRSEPEARGYGEATLAAARRVIAQQRAKSNE